MTISHKIRFFAFLLPATLWATADLDNGKIEMPKAEITSTRSTSMNEGSFKFSFVIETNTFHEENKTKLRQESEDETAEKNPCKKGDYSVMYEWFSKI